jgi:hypothetical protein
MECGCDAKTVERRGEVYRFLQNLGACFRKFLTAQLPPSPQRYIRQERHLQAELHLLPRQPIMPPAAKRAAVEGVVQLAFKAVQDVGDVAKTGGL